MVPIFRINHIYSYIFTHTQCHWKRIRLTIFMYEIHNLKNVIDDRQFLIIAKIVKQVHKDVKL